MFINVSHGYHFMLAQWISSYSLFIYAHKALTGQKQDQLYSLIDTSQKKRQIFHRHPWIIPWQIHTKNALSNVK